MSPAVVLLVLAAALCLSTMLAQHAVRIQLDLVTGDQILCTGDMGTLKYRLLPLPSAPQGWRTVLSIYPDDVINMINITISISESGSAQGVQFQLEHEGGLCNCWALRITMDRSFVVCGDQYCSDGVCNTAIYFNESGQYNESCPGDRTPSNIVMDLVAMLESTIMNQVYS